ncbi:MAG: hypothetical protein ABIY55_01580 [Kofleriaceae bacterium]
MRSSVAACLGVLVPACFQPVYEGTACGPNNACPAGLICRLDQNVCGQPTSVGLDAAVVDGSIGSTVVDASSDASVDATARPDAQACFGTLPRICFTALPTAAVQIAAGTVIDTTNSPMCNPDHDQADKYCVIAGASFTIPTGITLRANGPKPLVLISTTMKFDLSGSIDVSSKAGTNIGAGGNNEDCVAGPVATLNSGGAGGSSGGRGGDGKTIDGVGGIAVAGATTFPTKLRGGCKGGAGAGDPIGTGGNGGGAVEIIGPEVLIGGQINASGAAGRGGGPKKCGGGGGGSGGMIVIEAPVIMLVGTATVFANGGGGAQGGEGKGGGDGADGGEALDPRVPALGGNRAGLSGGAGAPGAAGTGSKDGDAAVNAAGSNGGGGGGGGASGFIRAPGATSTMIAPAPE